MCLRLEDDYINLQAIEYINPKTKLRIWLRHVMTQEPRQYRKKAEPKMERGESLNILSPILLNE